MSEKKKMGRPISENPKINRVEVKFSDLEIEKLDKLCKQNGLTRSELIRKLILKEK